MRLLGGGLHFMCGSLGSLVTYLLPTAGPMCEIVPVGEGLSPCAGDSAGGCHCGLRDSNSRSADVPPGGLAAG